MGAMKSGRYMTTPRGAARAQKRFDQFSTKHGKRFAKRGIDMATLGKTLGFGSAPGMPRGVGVAPVPGGLSGGVRTTPLATPPATFAPVTPSPVTPPQVRTPMAGIPPRMGRFGTAAMAMMQRQGGKKRR